MKILIVEDDILLSNTLLYNLKLQGYEVDSIDTIKETLEKVKDECYDLIVLDVHLPDGNGFDLCSKIKKNNASSRVIFLTANDMEIDQLRGYDLGADDYVTKPFSIRIFLKKIAVILSKVDKTIEKDCYSDGCLFINFTERVSTIKGQNISLTSIEYRILQIMIQNPKIVLTRNILLEKLWDCNDKFVDEHTLTSAMSRVRNKIENNHVQYIKTVYGMGYMWTGGIAK